ncbi:MAG: hypothetical protein AB7R89_05930 [Dehalococcoidia bacterium]
MSRDDIETQQPDGATGVFTIEDVPVVVWSPSEPWRITFRADLRYVPGEPGRWTVALSAAVDPAFA